MAEFRIPKAMAANLLDARKAALSENAHFGGIHGETVIDPFTGKTVDVDTFVKERIRLHHLTWIVSEIEAVLTWAGVPFPKTPISE